MRGGLVDFYPFGSRHPVRVELFGDEIESIRTFDPVTQRTTAEVPELDVLPQREMLLTPDTIAAGRLRGDLPFDEGASPFVDGIEFWLPRLHPEAGSVLEHFASDGVVVLEEPGRVADRVIENFVAATSAHEELRGRGHDIPAPADVFLDEPALAAALAGRKTLRLSLFPGERELGALRADGAAAPATPHKIRVNSQETFRGNFSVLRERLRGLLDEGNEIHLLCDNGGQLGRLEEMLDDLAERIRLSVAPLRNGFSLPESRLFVLTDHELFARSARRYRAFRYGGGAPIHDYSTLKRGDYVVHVHHGVGRYDGIHLLQTAGFESECLRVRYADDASVYVPMDQINLVQKYVGGEAGRCSGRGPPRDPAQWEKTKARVSRNPSRRWPKQLLGDSRRPRIANQGHVIPQRTTTGSVKWRRRSSTRRRGTSESPPTPSSAT